MAETNSPLRQDEKSIPLPLAAPQEVKVVAQQQPRRLQKTYPVKVKLTLIQLWELKKQKEEKNPCRRFLHILIFS
jgi:hypothetical protein